MTGVNGRHGRTPHEPTRPRHLAASALGSGDEGEFAVPMRLIDEGYRIVDISVEPDDGDPTHSGVSLARGELA